MSELAQLYQQAYDSSNIEVETEAGEQITLEPKEDSNTCWLCNHCSQPFGICIWIWILMFITMTLVVIIRKITKKEDDEQENLELEECDN